MQNGVVSFVLTADGYLKLCSEIQLDVKGLLNNTISKQVESDIKKSLKSIMHQKG